MANTPVKPQTAYSSDKPAAAAAPRPSAPRGRKVSDYGRQLAEKQKARNEYGLRETQFHRYFEKAHKSSVATGQALFTSLETRLDNVVFRAGFAKSRAMARQMVGHGHVFVNGKRVNMPSYPVKAGEVINLKKAETFEHNKEAILPDWLSYSSKTKSATVERMPKADDIVTDINSQLIIEFYSR
ncbi:MAG TPA: 30S ribosomal protein S4 [Patescibacteria group bacterium]